VYYTIQKNPYLILISFLFLLSSLVYILNKTSLNLKNNIKSFILSLCFLPIVFFDKTQSLQSDLSSNNESSFALNFLFLFFVVSLAFVKVADYE
jgi:hypothetical protein